MAVSSSAQRALLWIAVLMAAALLGTATLRTMTTMPGTSYAGEAPPLSAEEAVIAANLRRHVAAIAARERNMFHPEALEAAARYIETELEALGHTVVRQVFESGMGPARNIEASVHGSSGESIVVGAHYDSVLGSPGANDNGSGVAATLELARLMRAAAPARTLRFVWFVNEEPPFFRGPDMGSRRYVERLQARGERVAAMFALETIGYYSDSRGSQRYPAPLGWFYPDTGNFIGFVSNFASRGLLHEALDAFRRHARIPSEGVAAPAFLTGVDWSDHASFWAAGYPAIMVTDTAPYRYPHYHSLRDTPDRLDYERLSRVVSALARMLAELADKR